MESISILRDTRQRLQNELKNITIQFSKSIASQIGIEPISLALPKLKDASKTSKSYTASTQTEEPVAREVSESNQVKKDSSTSKLKLVKSFSSENQLQNLLMAMVNEQVEVKTSSGDISGILVSVERDFIQVGYTVLIPLNRIEVVTQMSGVDSK